MWSTCPWLSCLRLTDLVNLNSFVNSSYCLSVFLNSSSQFDQSETLKQCNIHTCMPCNRQEKSGTQQIIAIRAIYYRCDLLILSSVLYDVYYYWWFNLVYRKRISCILCAMWAIYYRCLCVLFLAEYHHVLILLIRHMASIPATYDSLHVCFSLPIRLTKANSSITIPHRKFPRNNTKALWDSPRKNFSTRAQLACSTFQPL